jgi:hypothetical protein
MAKTTNPMIFASDSLSMSAQCTNSVIFSAPTEVLEMLWTDISITSSITLFDMSYNEVIRAIGEGTMRLLEDPRIFADGLRTSTSTNISDGKLFIWLR